MSQCEVLRSGKWAQREGRALTDTCKGVTAFEGFKVCSFVLSLHQLYLGHWWQMLKMEISENFKRGTRYNHKTVRNF